jgi:hypothetical protein
LVDSVDVEVEGDEEELLGSSAELGVASIGGGRRRPWRRLQEHAGRERARERRRRR